MYSHLSPLIKKVGSSLSPEEFHKRINIVFHDFESEHYDNIHSGMRDSLQEQVDLLVNDLINSNQYKAKDLKLLDIGCGTGLSTKLVIDSSLGNHVNNITLLDSSPNMLKEATKKAAQWNKPFKTINGYLTDVDGKFDVIMICSVLHHIPDLQSFLKQVNDRLNPGGILIHLQDPNYDHLSSPIYLQRRKDYEASRNQTKKDNNKSGIISKELKRKLNIVLKRYDYIDRINNQLLAEKSIKKRMTADEIWGVTDIHVETGDKIRGISLQFLKEQLSNFTLINMRSYAFFEALKSDLAEDFREKENQLITADDKNGRNISCIWLKD